MLGKTVQLKSNLLGVPVGTKFMITAWKQKSESNGIKTIIWAMKSVNKHTLKGKLKPESIGYLNEFEDSPEGEKYLINDVESMVWLKDTH